MNRQHSNLTRVLAAALAVAAIVAMSGCGQKGDLYLPDPESRYSTS